MYFSQQETYDITIHKQYIMNFSCQQKNHAEKLNSLITVREKLISDRSGWKVSQNEQVQEFHLMKLKIKTSKIMST